MTKLTDEGLNLKQVIKALEIRLILEALQLADQNKALASRLLGISRTCLVEKMRKYEMPLNIPYKRGSK